MKEPRKVGLALIFLGVVVLLGNTTEALPPEAFFAGLILYPIGGYLFFKGSREAIKQAEVRAASIRAPRLRNETAEKYAAKQQSNIEAHGSVDSQMLARSGGPAETIAKGQARENAKPTLHELEIGSDVVVDDDAGNFNVTSDVSFPIEVQEQDSLAEQIMKLHKLQEDGIISDEEMVMAKAKLLS